MNLLPILFVFLMACGSVQVSDNDTNTKTAPENDATTSMPSQEATPPEDDVNIVTIWISHYQVPCVGEGDPSLCLLAQEGAEIDEEKWEYFYDVIEGFDDYKLGNIYQLKVNKTERKSVPEDAGLYDYRLVEVVGKDKVAADTTFDIPLKMSPDMLPFVMKMSDGEDFYLFDEIKVTVEKENLKTELEKAVNGGSTFAGTFTHSDSPKTIVLKSLQID